MAQSIPISQLSVAQLKEVLEKVDEEMEFISGSMQSLKTVQKKFVESKEAVERITQDSDGQELLVPLTSTLYASGRLASAGKFTIDIGTGYYAEMTTAQASDFFKRKSEFIGKEIEKLQQPLQEKYVTKQAVAEILQQKMRAAMQSQPAAASAVAP